jgi:hypothetical protein
MAEETAGIGNAAALITRAKPQDFGIVKGLKMAEASALAKAKMEAAAAAKKDTQLQKMSDMFAITPKYKTQIMADYAIPKTKRFYVNYSLAKSPEEQYMVRMGALQEANKDLIIDEKVYGMQNIDPNKYIQPSSLISTFSKTLKETKSNELPEGDVNLAVETMYNAQKPYLPPAYRQVQLTDYGDFDYTPIEKVNLPVLFNKVMSNVGRGNVVLSPMEDQYQVVRSFTDDDILDAADQIVEDNPDAVRYISNTDGWQKFYEEKYGKTPDLLNNPDNVKSAVKEYVINNLTNNYSQDRTSKGLRRPDISFSAGGGNVLNLGGKIFRQELAGIDMLANRFKLGNIKIGDNNSADVLIEALRKDREATGRPQATRIVTFPTNVPERFEIQDINRDDKNKRNVLPVAAYVNPSTGMVFLQYQEPESANAGQMYITRLDENGKTALSSHLNDMVKKKDKNNYVVDEIYKKFGVNFMPEGGTIMSGQNSKVKGVNTSNVKPAGGSAPKGKASESTLDYFKKKK